MTPEDLAERQPLMSRDGRLVLVSDGRIDNRRELSGELGLAWESPQIPDSAFMLAAYERWGEDCPRQPDRVVLLRDLGRGMQTAAACPVAIRRQDGLLP